MARIIPDRYLDNGSNAEKKIYEALRDSLPEDWIVIHSFRWLKVDPLRGRKFQGEGDFVIFNPKHGVLVIEVKGGNISYEYGTWTSTDFHNTVYDIQDPEKQANDTKFEIIRRLKTERVNNCNVWHAVWFPDMNRLTNDELPASLDEIITLTKESLLDVLNSINDVYSYWENISSFRKTKLNNDEASKVEKLLIKRIHRVKTLTQISDEINEIYVRLNTDQLKLLENLENFNELSIKGRAGTGKTLLALEKARIEAGEDKKVLFLCYNRELAKRIRNSIIEYSQVSVHTIHSYALEYMKLYHPSRIIGFEDDPDFEYLMEEFIEVADKKKELFDTIIIDEGQDFSHLWINAIRHLKRDDGKFYLFYDPFQELYSAQEKINDSYLIFGGPVILKKNMRNTDEITRSLHNVLEIDFDEDVLNNVTGLKPEIRLFAENEDYYSAINSKLIELVNKKIFDPQKITVISLDNLKNETELKIIEGIEYTTVRKFKGLENDVIVIINADLSHTIDPVKKRLLYVALSRAKVHCIILFCMNNKYRQFALDRWKCKSEDLETKISNFIIQGEV